MIAIDLFAGAGGLSLGLSLAGFNVQAALENDEHAVKTYKKNHPQIKDNILSGDITDYRNNVFAFLEKTKLKKNEINLIAGGPPCQGYSMANGHSRNREKPHEDEKNKLVEDFIGFVEAIEPDAFIMENVVGFLSLQEKFSPPLVDRFKSLGYHNTTVFVLNAAEFGVPQKRRRVFVIGSKNNIVFGANQFEQYKTTLNKPLTVQDALFGDLPKICEGTKGYLEPVSYLDKKPTKAYQEYLREGSLDVHNHVTTVSSEEVLARFAKINPGHNGISIGLNKKIRIQFSSCYKRLEDKQPAITMSNFRKSMIMPPSEDRILSVREAARLQSFPDRYIFEGGISSMQQQVGNAVPPLLAKAVGEMLIAKVFS